MMVAVTKVEVQNLIYVAGALVLIVILSIFVTIRHRKPKSVESNMATFNKGLRALAPDSEPARRRSRPSPVRPTPSPQTLRRTVTIRPAAAAAPDDDLAPEDDEAVGPIADGATGATAVGGSGVEGGTAVGLAGPGADPAGQVRRITADNPTSLEAETG